VERRKVSSKVEDDAKSVLDWELHQSDPRAIQFRERRARFDTNRPERTPTEASVPFQNRKNQELALSRGHWLPHARPKPNNAFPIAIDAITAQFREEPPQNSSDKSRGGGGTSWVNPRKHAEGAAYSKATVHDF